MDLIEHVVGCTTTKILASIVVGATIVYLYYKRKFSLWKNLGVKGPPPTIFFGNIIDSMSQGPIQTQKANYDSYGHVYGIYELTVPQLFISDPELVKKIMIQDFSSFVNRKNAGYSHPLEKEMMFVLKDDKWRKWRQVFTKGFTAHQMKEISDTLNENALVVMEKVGQFEGTGMDVKELGRDFALPNIFDFAIGLDFKQNPEVGRDVKMQVENMFEMGYVSILQYYLLPSFIKTWINYSIFEGKALDHLTQISQTVIEQRIQNKQKRNDFLTLSLESVDGLNGVDEVTMNQLISNTILFLAAGFETTSTLVGLSGYVCARFPEIQENIYQSVTSVVTKVDNITYDQIKEMTYLKAFIDEVLRMYPVSIVSERESSCEYNLNGILLPKGQVIYIPTYLMHHDPESWENPETFDPTRFMSENKDKIKPGTYIPFGDGPRSCPGNRFALLQTQILLAHIIVRFRIEPTKETPSFPLDVFETKDEVIEFPKLIMSFKKR